MIKEQTSSFPTGIKFEMEEEQKAASFRFNVLVYILTDSPVLQSKVKTFLFVSSAVCELSRRRSPVKQCAAFLTRRLINYRVCC